MLDFLTSALAFIFAIGVIFYCGASWMMLRFQDQRLTEYKQEFDRRMLKMDQALEASAKDLKDHERGETGLHPWRGRGNGHQDGGQ